MSTKKNRYNYYMAVEFDQTCTSHDHMVRVDYLVIHKLHVCLLGGWGELEKEEQCLSFGNLSNIWMTPNNVV